MNEGGGDGNDDRRSGRSAVSGEHDRRRVNRDVDLGPGRVTGQDDREPHGRDHAGDPGPELTVDAARDRI
ncbi:MAG: hypothetical protein M3462_06860, partial [Chloroflexota bacterium]|nr:hypothetical protein [Chloroflexota bacterium]